MNAIELYVCQGRMEAELLRGMLEEEGIDCGMREIESTPFPTSGHIMGEVVLVVDESQAAEARELIENTRENNQVSEKGYFRHKA